MTMSTSEPTILSSPAIMGDLMESDWKASSIKPFDETTMSREQWLQVAVDIFQQRHHVVLEREALKDFRETAVDYYSAQ